MTGNEAFLSGVVPSIEARSPLLTGFETNTLVGIGREKPLGLSIESDALTLDESTSTLENSANELAIPLAGRTNRLNHLFRTSPIFIPEYNQAQLLSGNTDELTGQVDETPLSNPILEALKGSVDPLYGDADGDDDVDNNDLQVILDGRNAIATSPDDRRDLDGDGRITTLDARKLIIYLQTNKDFDTPNITVELARDTAPGNTTNSDGITFDLGILGSALDESLITRLRAGINEMPVENFVDILGARQTDGSFSLNREQLEAIYGAPLADGKHRLKLWAKDQWANRTDIVELAFTLDTVAPPLTLGLEPASDTGVLGDLATEQEIVILTGQTEANLTVTLVQSGTTITADETGQYSFSNVALTEGENTFTVTTADIAGNESSITQVITRVVVNTPPTVDADKDLSVDEDSNATLLRIGAPVDDDDDPLTITVTTIPEVSKGSVQLADGSSLVTGQILSTNELTELVFVPVENESGEAGEFSYTVDDGQGNSASQTITLTIAPINDGPNIMVPAASAVESGAELSLAGIVVSDIDADTGELEATITVSNGVLSLRQVDGLAFLTGDGLDDNTVIFTGTLAAINSALKTLTYRSNDGFSGAETVEINVSDLGNIGAGGSLTASSAIDLTVFGSLNQAPEFVSDPVTEVLVGQTYYYDSDAVDGDGDLLTYELLAGPDGLTVDSETGQLRWTPAVVDEGTHAVSVQVTDGQGGQDIQTYTLSVLNDVPNRPPNFVTAPVVDASVNVPYEYDSDAVDPDSDILSYRLIEAPNGMVVDETTGELAWKPTVDQLGIQTVALEVTDGRGGTTTQEFEILAQQEPGNNAPVIVSDPVTRLQNSSVREEPELLDLSSWSVEKFSDGGSSASWTIDPTDNTVVRQSQNANPSIFLGDFEVVNDRIDGTWRVDTASDDDFMGFVFGYQDPQHFYLFDWKQRDQNSAEMGMSIKLVSADTPVKGNDLWPTVGREGRVETLFHNRIGWKDYADYQFTLDFAPGEFIIAVKEEDTVLESITIKDDTYTSGKFGFYNYSQANILYNGFTRQPLVSFEDYKYDVNAVDPDDDELVYSLVDAPTGATINSQNGLIEWSPTGLTSSAQLPVSVRVDDGRGGFDIQDYTIEIPDTLLGEIRGLKFNDLNGDGVHNISQEPTATLTSSQPYLSFADSPFRELDFSEFYLEDFEDLLLNTPGVSAVPARDLGIPIDLKPFSGKNSRFIDSVDGDDGAIDGNGSRGTSFVDGFNSVGGSAQGVRFTFDQDELGYLPTHVGIVWTENTPNDTIIFEAFDAQGKSLGQLEQPTSFDGNFAGNTNEDIFFSAVYADGISAIAGYGVLENRNSFEVDHLQYGAINQGDAETVEGGIAGVSVYLDLNNNGVLDLDEPSQLTATDNLATPDIDETGQYRFTGLLPGDYTVRELVPPGYVQTFPENSEYHLVSLDIGEVVEGINFGNQLTEEISVNGYPVFTTTAPTVAEIGERLRYESLATDPDFDGLIYDLPVKPEGMVINPATGVVFWEPTSDQAGQTFDVILRVQDGRSGFDLQPFQIEVPASNTAPTITSTPAETAVAGLPYQYRIKAQDAEDDPLTYELVEGPVEATVDGETGVLSFTPELSQLGAQTFTLGVKDGNGGETTQSFILSVVANAPNVEPVILSTPRLTTRLEQQYRYQMEATDANGDPLTYRLTAAPAGATLDENGLLLWTPAANQFGANEITLEVTDGRGGVATQTFNVDVVSQDVNSVPEIVSMPVLGATANREYRYDPVMTDADNDIVVWSLESGPLGMSVEPETGAVRWTPTLEQLGDHTITLQALDGVGGTTTQTFDINVRGVNTPPVISSVPRTQTAIGENYTYTVTATDEDGDSINYSLVNAPDGMTIDSATGEIVWTPRVEQFGTQTIDLLATDGQGGAATQTYSLSVVATRPNSPPIIDSLPSFVAVAGAPYSYDVDAFDPDGDSLIFNLLDAPDGMTIAPVTGLVQWTPDESQQGSTSVKISVTDPSGGRGSQSFPLLVRANDAPTILSKPATSVAAGEAYNYAVLATDPNADLLNISLIDGPDGMTLDEFGRLQWTPTNDDIGNTYEVTVAVADPYGATDTQTYSLAVEADIEAPLVSLLLTENRVDIGEAVTVQVEATDNVGVEAITLLVNDTPVALDAKVATTLPIDTVGAVNLLAMATDAAGNTGTSTTQVFGLDPFDTAAPIVNFSNLVDGTIFTAPEDILGTVTDDNLLSYSLSIAPILGGDFVEIASGTEVVTDSILGAFDPTVLQNDSYILRLSATDLGGLSSTVDAQVEVTGELKLGNFQLSFTDLSIPVSGIPIQVTRTYDSLTSSSTDDFGYGWRMEFRDTDLRTSVASTGAEAFGSYAPFREGTRVYVTMPGGKREGFTFRPKRAPGIKGRFLGIHEPEFVADSGVTSTLSVSNFDLVKSGNEFYTFSGRLPFNPADAGVSNGQYTLTTKEGIVYQINAEDGDLMSVRDRNNNTLTFTDSGITSSTGQEVTFERDAAGRIFAVIDPEGNRITYEYDALGDLVTVTDREDNVTRFDYNDERAHYLQEIIDPLKRSGMRSEYDEQGRLTRMLDANGKQIELRYKSADDTQQVVDQLGNVTTYVYDERGNILTEINADGVITRTYDGDSNMLSETDPLNNTTKFTYDNDGDVLTETDALGNVTRYTYDANGNVLTTTDPTGQTVTNTYDKRGNLTKIEGQASGPLSFSYDVNGNLRTLQDGSGTTTFEYDRIGNITRQIDALGTATVFTYDNNGNRTSETTTQTLADGSIRTLVTRMEYDDEGRVIRTIDAQGGVTETVYDAVGNRIEEIDALGRSTKYVYDDRGQLIETIYPDGTPNDDSDNPRTQTEYDAAGQVVAEIDELGRRTLFIYDKLGRQIATIHPDGTPNDDSDNPRTQTEYDAAGRVVAEIDELDNRTEFRYDKAGRVIETILPDETPDDLSDNPSTIITYDAAGRQLTQTDPLEQVTQFRYDELGRPVGQVYADGTSTSVEFDAAGWVAARTDQAGVITRYEYDALGRLNTVIDTLEQRTEYTYDEQGNLLTQTDANGNTTRYEYDPLGRRVATELPLGERSSSTYDAVGNLTSTTDFNGDIKTYIYDERNRLIAKDLPGTEFDETHTYTANGLRETVTDGRGTTTYQYDERNRLTRRIDPDGTTIAYSYDAAGNRTSVQIPSGTTGYSFDAQNRLKTVTDPDGGVTTYIYNPVGNLERTEFPNGTVEIREYDELNRLVYIETSGPEGVIASFRYTLDKTGNRTAVEEHDGRQVDYEYDDLYRLTAEIITDPGATEPTRTIEYIYDAVGNRLSRTDTGEGTTIYTYDDNDRLLNAITDGVATTYTYDNNGNTTSKTTDGNTITYTWNADNRLIGADTDGDNIVDVTNQYNENGIRVSQTVDGEETRFLIDANRPYAQVLEEYASDGIIEVSYVHGNDLISQNHQGDYFFYHVDGLGSTSALSNKNGARSDQYFYDAFGQIIQKAGITNNSYLFAGEQRDSNLNTDYLRARYLDRSTGRFYAQDPFGGFLSSPVSLHRYLYANNNPVNFIDPSGEFSIVGVTTSIAKFGLDGIRLAAKDIAQATASIIAIKKFIDPGFKTREVGVNLVMLGDDTGFELYQKGNDLIAFGAKLLQTSVNATEDISSALGVAKVGLDIAKIIRRSPTFRTNSIIFSNSVSGALFKSLNAKQNTILRDAPKLRGKFVDIKEEVFDFGENLKELVDIAENITKATFWAAQKALNKFYGN